jgi:2-haloacid dehalogenase
MTDPAGQRGGFDVVAFDLYGTLLDVSGLAARMRPVVGEGAAELLGRWRRAQLERTWRLNREGRYEPWNRVTGAALAEVVPELAGETRERLAELWLMVPAFPDASATLEALRSAGVRRVVLSNGTRAMIERALDAGGLGVDAVLSADDVRAYKTDPRVYALLDGEADRARTLFVSSNGWDADGARRDGRTVAWIDRGGEPPAASPNYRVVSLSEVAALPRGQS